MQKFTCENKTKLSDFLLDKYQGGLSYGKFCTLLRKKDIKINQKRVNKDCVLQKGDIVECYFDAEIELLTPIYKDENVVVLNKPQSITSEDFYNRVKGQYATAIFTHRLDRNTSGVMIFALNEESYGELYQGFKNRTFSKTYHCLVNGAFEKKQALLQDYMVKDEKIGLVKVYSNAIDGAKIIKTQYEEIARAEFSSLLKVQLITGRTHQIRAHLAYHGHFIIGDGKYGSERVNKIFKVSKQLLIATNLELHFSEQSLLFYLNGKNFSVDYSGLFKYLK